MGQYTYPMEADWSREELLDVIALYNAVEAAYESGIAPDEFAQRYRRFKEIVPSKSQEKQIGRAFEASSGYSIYHVYKAWQDSKDQPHVKRLHVSQGGK